MTPLLRSLMLVPALLLAACGGDTPSPGAPQPGVPNPGTPNPGTPAPAERVVVSGATRFQTIDGWATHLRMWEEDKSLNQFDKSVETWADAANKFLVDSVGINSVRLEIPSAIENPNNRWKEFSEGRMSYTTWQSTRYEKFNDNADPNSTNLAGFTFANLDWRVEKMMMPLKRALEARGEKLHVNVNYTDFKWSGSSVQGTLSHGNNPAEFAEFVTVCFIHLRDKYGIVPDAFEVILEPENTDGATGWTSGVKIGRAIVAAVDRLKANGFNPEIIAPSNAVMGNAISYFDEMMTVAGVSSRVKTFNYHRYGSEQTSQVQTIRSRAQANGLKTAMLEKVDAGIDVLFEDLTVGQVSAWQQWAAAGSMRNSDNGGYYGRVDVGTGKVSMARLSDQLSQVMLFVRRGAVRVESRASTDKKTMAFINPDGSWVVVIRTHAGVAPFAVEGLPAGSYAQRFVSDARQHTRIAPVAVAQNGLLTTGITEAGVLTVYGTR